MRRSRLIPLVTVVVLATLLLPAHALGLLGTVEHPDGDATPASIPSLLPGNADGLPSGIDAGRESPGANGLAMASGTAALEPGNAGAPPSGAPPSEAPPSGAPPSEAPPPDPPIVDRAPATPFPTAATRPVSETPPAIKLACSLLRPDALWPVDPMAAPSDVAPAVDCRWSAVDGGRVRAYQLWRAVDAPGGGPRELIATVPAGDPLRHVDRDVTRGHAYTYAVVAVARDGSKVAVSKSVTVRVPAPWETLRLACELVSASIDASQRGVACKWSEATHPAAAGYVLWRSVDGGPREPIYRAGLDGRRAFLDTEVKPGQAIRYAVVAVDKAGAIVGLGGPVLVRIPAIEPQATDPVASGVRS